MLQYTTNNGKLCVSGLMELIGKYNWDALRKRTGLQVVLPHAPGRSAVVSFDSIRPDIRQRIVDTLGNPGAYTGTMTRFVDTITKDIEAFEWFSEKNLSSKHIERYTNEASILNAITRLQLQHNTMNKFSNDYLRIAISNAERINEMWNNRLPWSEKRLKLKHEAYKHEKYESLIHRGVGNNNRRKVDAKLEKLIIYFKCRPHKPYDKTVVRMYDEWMLTGADYYDSETGELLFERNDYMRNGTPLSLDERTVKLYCEMPHNRQVIDRLTMNFHDYNNAQRPYVHRDNNIMSNSKLSLDDFDLPLCDQGFRPKAYGAFDIGSQCLIGYAVSRKKDERLFEDCMRNTLLTVHNNNLGMPAEVEVENHLVKKYFTQLAEMFPFMRICAPTNSREKKAERLIEMFKYEILKQVMVGVGRYHLRNKQNRVDINRVNDEDVQAVLPYSDVKRLFIDAVQMFNNSHHTNQELYPGMTRMQVYLQNQNPDLKPFKPHIAAKYFGFSHPVPVNIYNNMYVKAANGKYMLPEPDLMQYFKNGKAYVKWLPLLDGSVSEVYLYTNPGGGVTDVRDEQQDVYMCTCLQIEEFKNSQAEMTAIDYERKALQDKYIAKYDASVERRANEIRRIAKVVNTETESLPEEVPQPVEIENNFDVEPNNEFEFEYEYTAVNTAIDDL